MAWVLFVVIITAAIGLRFHLVLILFLFPIHDLLHRHFFLIERFQYRGGVFRWSVVVLHLSLQLVLLML